VLSLTTVDTTSRAQVQRFVQLPFRLYAGHPLWVPPLQSDTELYLDHRRHPLYEHSEAEFFLATRAGRDVGRLAVLANRRYNAHHGLRRAQFYLFECENDAETAGALFERGFEWARARGLTEIVGPKGFSALDAYGMLVEGFEHRPAMMMAAYNFDYYPRLLEQLGFEKEVDFVSCYLDSQAFRLPERIHRIADRVRQRSRLEVRRFKSKPELIRWARRIGEAYNRAFVNNWEYYPLTEREIGQIVETLTVVADHRLIKIITHDEEVVGFLFAFPDVSAALQRTRGQLLPFGFVDLLLEMRRTKWVCINGAGILPAFHGVGGNALLYSEMEKTIREFGFQNADLSQVAETAVQMQHDLENLGARPYKNHRVFVRAL